MTRHFSKFKRFSLLSISLSLFIVYLPITIPVMTVAVLCSWFGSLFKKPNLKEYGFNLALSYDRFGNVAVFLGASTETISSRLGKAMLAKKARWWVPFFAKKIDLIAKVGFGESNHVINSIENVNTSAELVSWIVED